jgi:ppGpp synthetase/RelA/SpoT-type nucleotidyltranferase
METWRFSGLADALLPETRSSPMPNVGHSQVNRRSSISKYLHACSILTLSIASNITLVTSVGVHTATSRWPRMVETPVPEIIARFLEEYENKYDHYKDVTKSVEALLVKGLNDLTDSNDQPVQARVSSRAKGKESLQKKLEIRHGLEGRYKTQEDIWNDIVDIAGVRILLYTANDEQQNSVKGMIQDLWGVDVKPRIHPDPGRRKETPEKGQYIARHEGYRALHYQVIMKKRSPVQGQYDWVNNDRVEIQVVSALAHAWSEAEHEIKYKTEAYGEPTEEEERLLDALSGLVSSGELILEQLMKSVNGRTYGLIEHGSDFDSAVRQLGILRDRNFRDDFSMQAVDFMFRFLKVLKPQHNYPLAVHDALLEFGFPNESKATKMKATMDTFRKDIKLHRGARIPLCLVRHWFHAHKEQFASHKNIYPNDFEIPLTPPTTSVTAAKKSDRKRLKHEIDLKRKICSETMVATRIFTAHPSFVSASSDEEQLKSQAQEARKKLTAMERMQSELALVDQKWQWMYSESKIKESLLGMMFRIVVAMHRAIR